MINRCALAAFLSGLAALSSAQLDRPLPLRIGRSASMIFLRPMALGDVLSPSTQDLSRELTMVTEARRLPGVVEDAETWRLTHRWRRGDKDGEWIAELPLVWRSGGILDGVIQGWEQDVMGYTNPNRVGFPKYQSEITLPGGSYGSAAGLGDIVVGRGFRLGGRNEVRAWLKVPTGDPSKLLGSGRAEVGASFEGAYRLSPKFSLGYMAAVTTQSNATSLTGAKSQSDNESVNLTYQPNSRDAWILEFDSESAPFDTGMFDLDRIHRATSLGYRRRFNDKSDFTVYFTEDNDFTPGPFSFSKTAADFTLGFVTSVRY